MAELMDESYARADDVIRALLQADKGDYTPARELIAEAFDNDLFNGNWDSHVQDLDQFDLADLRIIEENEYDQSMDEDEDRPGDDDAIYAGGYYVFVQ